MNTITYGITEEIYCMENGTRTSYGIAAYADAAELGSASVIASVRDISDDREAVARLAELCSRMELPPYQLEEIVEDFLGK